MPAHQAQRPIPTHSLARTSDGEGAPLDAVLLSALSLVRSGDTEGALRLIEGIARSARSNTVACHSIALICMSASRYRDAIRWFDSALARTRFSAQAFAGKGLALQCLGRTSQAVSCYDMALSIRKHDPETLYNRGAALQALGRLDAALASYDAALEQRPIYLFAMRKRCAILEMHGRLQEALAGLEDVLAIAPDCADTWCNRGNVLQKLRRWPQALACYDRSLAIQGDAPATLVNRAAALKELGRLVEALSDVSAALALSPQEPEALLLRGNVLQALERAEEAENDFRHAHAIRPLIHYAAIKSPAEFTALFVFCPQAGNTPYEDVISNSDFTSNVLLLLPGTDYDIRALRRHSDVVVNLLSDVDSGRERVLQVRDLIDAIGKPAVNHPSKMLLTDREQVSRTLADIADCRVPTTRRIMGAAVAEMLGTRGCSSEFPLVARVAGTHGGDRMERIDTYEQLAQFVGEDPAAAYYLSHYVDYKSSDGLFRKYRFMYVGDEILPYHLAIGERWKVHHVSTNMGDHLWMRAEEQRFLESPESMFGPTAYETLRTIRERIGLDYFGIDCSLDQQGRIIVFEVNASMLVHMHNEQFPYKNDAVANIKSAFGDMLRKKIATRNKR